MVPSLACRCFVTVAVSLTAAVASAGQTPAPAEKPAPVSSATPAIGELEGRIVDDAGRPLAGVLVMALGASTQAYEISDRDGRFAFRNLARGAYMMRARQAGYVPYNGRYVQIAAGGRQPFAIVLKPLSAADKNTLLAGVGGADPPSVIGERDTSETAWRLRRVPRGVLKDEGNGDGAGSVLDDPIESVRRATDSPVRASANSFTDLTFTGQVNVLTGTSFHRPQELLSLGANVPHPVTFITLAAPTGDGDWFVRGALTQGDISSWILAGSFLRRSDARHRYEAGASYSTQQYQGGNPDALVAFGEGRRTVGELFVYDTWSVNRRLSIAYGGKYGSYWYLDNPSLMSGRMSVSFMPSPEDPLTIRVSMAHREVAPGAEEFALPAIGPWLPPQRTFSSLTKAGLEPESIEHFEIAGEGQVRGSFVVGVRAFRQRVDDQIVTLFGVAVAETSDTLGHYRVANIGDFHAFGWGASVSRTLNGAMQGSIDYTQFQVSPIGAGAGDDVRARLSPALLRRQQRVHDVTATLNSRVALTATRFLVIYKWNTAYADVRTMEPLANARFEIQVNQELPFLDFTHARWEVIAGVRNLYRSELFDGSVYDELMVVRPPKRVVGGLTVRF